MSHHSFGGLTLPVGQGAPIVPLGLSSTTAPPVGPLAFNSVAETSVGASTAAPVITSVVLHASERPQATLAFPAQAGLTAPPDAILSLPTKLANTSSNGRSSFKRSRSGSEKRKAQNRKSQKVCRARNKERSALMVRAQEHLQIENDRLKEENEVLLEMLAQVQAGYLPPCAIVLPAKRSPTSSPLRNIDGQTSGVLAPSSESRSLDPSSGSSCDFTSSPSMRVSSAEQISGSFQTSSAEISSSRSSDGHESSGESSPRERSHLFTDVNWTRGDMLSHPEVGDAHPTMHQSPSNSQSWEQSPHGFVDAALAARVHEWYSQQEPRSCVGLEQQRVELSQISLSAVLHFSVPCTYFASLLSLNITIVHISPS
ncbi:hypothetical protein BCV69DRAFT_135634 [Microstroma glucosiphilum]|uniref:BZIP domain-containing protein n=1 Tax=Pseudomicrostroma glucosiphilum TaxID=1684307 RepID=A0A316UGA6_9BASI|nr:hypothetical protein BCV69DRAFT_135634 [Pseudomicrostroma glucosiphilum]PWN22185.1 hypothetical protein BCV69DRAFT_135634 [Pseudomicrostroma glucosiphilum]